VDVITILTKEYNYNGDILEIPKYSGEIPTENSELRSISELINCKRANLLWQDQRDFDRYLNI